MLIFSAVKPLGKGSKKRSGEHVTFDYSQKKGNSINQQTLSLSIASFVKMETY